MNTSNVTIREAGEVDCGGIAEAHVSAWRSAYRGILPAGFLESLSVPRRQDSWHTILERAWSRVIVAESDGSIVGFACLGPPRDSDVSPSACAEISAIYVVEEAWGTGVGRLLFERACSMLREAGYHEVTLWVLRDNDRARGFYEHMGMALDSGTKEAIIGPERFPEVRYRMPIAVAEVD